MQKLGKWLRKKSGRIQIEKRIYFNCSTTISPGSRGPAMLEVQRK
jgi:hypothetical protein